MTEYKQQWSVVQCRKVGQRAPTTWHVCRKLIAVANVENEDYVQFGLTYYLCIVYCNCNKTNLNALSVYDKNDIYIVRINIYVLSRFGLDSA